MTYCIGNFWLSITKASLFWYNGIKSLLVLQLIFIAGVFVDDEAEGLKHPPSYINQSKWMDYYATLEASRTPEIALDM